MALLRDALSLKIILYGPKLQLGFYDVFAPLDLHQNAHFCLRPIGQANREERRGAPHGANSTGGVIGR